MKTVVKFGILLSVKLSLFSAVYTNRSPEITRNFNGSTLQLFYIANSNDQNIVISPYSIYTSLLMLLMGAEDSTANEIKEFLTVKVPFKQIPTTYKKNNEAFDTRVRGKDSYRMDFANAFWVNQNVSIVKSYKSEIRYGFNAKVFGLDFAQKAESVSHINRWINAKTHGMIPEFLNPNQVDSLTEAIVTCVLSFQGKWKTAFPTGKTQKLPFYRSNNRTDKLNDIETMQLSIIAPYFENDQVQAISLPIRKHLDQADIDFVVFLPKKTSSNPFEALYSTYQTKEGSFLDILKEMQDASVNLKLPKFEFNSEGSMKEYLQLMGVKEAFTSKANFSRMFCKNDLYISQFLYGNKIKVSEQGISAAAASGASFSIKGGFAGNHPHEMTVDYPFVFMLIEKSSNLILFLGQFATP